MKIQNMKIILLCMVLFFILPWAVRGEDFVQSTLVDENSLIQLEQAVEEAVKKLDVLEKDLETENKLLEEEGRQKDIYTAQMNSLRNFLIVPEIRISLLEKGIGEVDISLSLVKSRIQRIRSREEKATQNLSLVNEKIRLIDQRMMDLESGRGKIVEINPGIKILKNYRLIKEKHQHVLLKTTEVLALQIGINNDLLDGLKDIRETLIKEIKEKKGGRLSQRNERGLETLFSQTFKLENSLSFTPIRQLFSLQQAALKWSLFKAHTNLKTVMIIVGFLLVSFLCHRWLALVRVKETYQQIIKKRTGYPLMVLERSQVLIFWIILATILSKTEVYLVFPDGVKFLKSFLIIVLMTRIASDSIRFIARETRPVFLEVLNQWRNIFVYGIRIYSFFYLLLYRLFFFDPLSLVLVRIFSEGVLVVGVFLFWAAYNRMDDPSRGLGETLLRLGSKTLVITGLFADIAGYGYFAVFWYISWGISIVVVCVCVMSVYSIKDIAQKFEKKIEPVAPSGSALSKPFYWVVSNGVYFIVMAFGIIGLAFSWGIGGIVFVRLGEIFHKTYMIGGVELSLAGFFYSILVLVLVHLFVRILRPLITEHALKESGLSPGAKETIITISVYIIWSMGILFSLSVFGLNTTSLTVAFGALSIGLGFGMQNIANNFVSGLILLFERPIQVGDVVEVGGIWGEVKKINVRSTHVQTYTNSSLIIPNSEFISATVTNWSHQDPYVRRDLAVGVAYGSDTGLVQKLLLQAAGSVAGVYNYPKKPVVQFINFGDSSLDFRLRFWSTIDDFVEAESKLRFEIDRLFRENDVVIPFPQRDLHIASGFQPKI